MKSNTFYHIVGTFGKHIHAINNVFAIVIQNQNTNLIKLTIKYFFFSRLKKNQSHWFYNRGTRTF